MSERFTLQDFDRLDIAHRMFASDVVSAHLYVADARDSRDDAPSLCVHVLYSIEHHRVIAAHATGLLLPDGREACFTDADDLALELTDWACRCPHLVARCEDRWLLHLETLATENAAIEAGDAFPRLLNNPTFTPEWT